MKNISLYLRKARPVCLIFLALLLFPHQTIFAAFTTNDLQSILLKRPYYDPSAGNACSTSVGDTSGTGGTTDSSGGNPLANSGSWNSGLQPPYILEQFAIEVLKDVAQKKGIDPSITVTQEHVIALLAFMIGEGGDIANGDLYNPLNTGINAPDLINGAHAGNGVQSFKSFDAGVEATARTMFKTTQSRLSDILAQQASTAQDFMHTLTYYGQFPNNLFWAEASTGANAEGYYQGRLKLVDMVRSKYALYGSIILGTPAHEITQNIRDPSKLQFNSAGGSTGPQSGSGTGANCCPTSSPSNTTAVTATNLAPPGTGPIIVLDPGHATHADQEVDPQTNLAVREYANHPEMEQMYDVAVKIKAQLETSGYRVIITKQSPDDTNIDLRKRAEIGNQAGAALGVSLHTSPGSPQVANDVFYPKVGEYRQTSDGKSQLTYQDQTLSDTDKKAAAIMQAERQAAEGQPVRSGSYGDLFGLIDRSVHGVIEKGNMLTTQYFAKIPWVYNEKAQDGANGSTSAGALDKYATGVVNGVKKIVSADGQSSSSPGATNPASCLDGQSGIVAGNIVQTALNFAWPEPFSKAPASEKPPQGPRTNALVPTPAYATALEKFNPAGLHAQAAGADCGVFVATVMHSTGADPSYPASGTSIQAAYVRANPAKYDVVPSVASTAELLPGDIMIVEGHGGPGHTYIYIGPQPNGYNQASASLNSRMPNLGMADLADNRGQYMRARLKK